MLLGYSFGAHIAVEIARMLYGRDSKSHVQLVLADSSVERRALRRFASPSMTDAVYCSFRHDVEPSHGQVDGICWIASFGGLRDKLLANWD